MAKRNMQVHDDKKPFLAGNKERSLRNCKVGPNLLSKRMMDSLSSMCDTLIPSIDISDSTRDEDLIEFYGTSASMAGVPDHIGSLISGVLKHPSIGLFKIALWLLSTWYGTLLLCGVASLSRQFPYVQKFSKVDRKKREKILLSWSSSSISILRDLYKCLKYVTMLTYFSQVDENNKNPAWRSIGYCGPDPNFIEQSQLSKCNTVNTEEALSNPMYPSLLYMHTSRDLIAHKLNKAGFPKPTTTTTTSPSFFTIHCDVVIIGSGSGGCVVAGVLAKVGYKVIVIEKGHYFQKNHLSLLEGPSMNNMYEGGGLVATDDVGVLFLAGSTIGGGSTINWAASIRTPDHVRREWCNKHELKLFGSKAYDYALDVVCERMGVQSHLEDEGFSNMILRKGCEELGLPVNDVPFNAPPDHYCGWCNFGCKDGKKKSTQETWLVDLGESGNGFIIPGCSALRVVHYKVKDKERRVASGVICMVGSQEFKVEAKITVVACGALNTPPLLKRSGLKNPNIGKHLQIHPAILAWGYFPPNTWPDNSKKSYEGNIITCMSLIHANFSTSGYGTLIQTPALHPGMFATLTPWTSPTDFRERMTRFSRTAHLFSLVRDKGTGNASNYPWSLTYRIDNGDEEKMKKALETMLRVLVAAGAEEIGVQHDEGERVEVKVNGGKGVEELIRKVRGRGVKDGRTPVSSAHQMGSCRMGVKPRDGVVSSKGETWEVEGLYLADTSVFPTALGVNPMVTVQAIAYCTAQSILEALERKVW